MIITALYLHSISHSMSQITYTGTPKPNSLLYKYNLSTIDNVICFYMCWSVCKKLQNVHVLVWRNKLIGWTHKSGMWFTYRRRHSIMLLVFIPCIHSELIHVSVSHVCQRIGLLFMWARDCKARSIFRPPPFHVKNTSYSSYSTSLLDTACLVFSSMHKTAKLTVK